MPLSLCTAHTASSPCLPTAVVPTRSLLSLLGLSFASHVGCIIAIVVLLLPVQYADASPVSTNPANEHTFLTVGHFNSNHLHSAASAFGFTNNETYAGIFAAFQDQNDKGGIRGKNLTIRRFEDLSITFDFMRNAVIAAAKQTDYLATIAPFLLGGLSVVNATQETGAPIIGQQSLSDSFYAKTTPNADKIIHHRVTTSSEISAILNFAVNSHLHCKHFMVLHSEQYGIPQHGELVKNETVRIGLPEPILVSFPSPFEPHFPAALQSFIAQYIGLAVKPKCIFFFADGATLAATLINLRNAYPAYDVEGTNLIALSWSALPQWVDSNPPSAADRSKLFQNLYQAQQFPHPADTRYQAVQSFHQSLARLKVRGNLDITSVFQPTYGGLEGYLAGRFAIEVLKRVDADDNITRTTIVDAVYNTRTFPLDDIVLGPYSRGCVGHQQSTTGPCFCTAGTKQLFFSRISGTAGVPVPVFDDPDFPGVAEVPVPLTDCELSSTFLQPPYIVLVPRDSGFAQPTGYGRNTSAAGEVQAGIVAALKASAVAARKAGRLTQGPLYAQPHTGANVTNATISDLDARYRLVVMVGSAVDDARMYPAEVAALRSATGTTALSTSWTIPYLDIGPAQAAFPDRDVSWLPAAQHNPRRIAFYPTLTDLAMAAAAYVAWTETTAGQVATAVSVVADSAALTSLARQCVETKLRRAPTAAVVLTAPASTAAFGAMGISTMAGSFVIVVTREPSVIAAAEAFAAANAGVTVVLAADEYVLEGAASSTAANVKFVSGLPSYDAGAGSARKAYAAALAATVLALYELRTNGTAEAIAAAAFKTGSLTVGDVALSPLSFAACPAITAPTWPHPGGDCQCSKGLNQFNVVPLSTLVTRTAGSQPEYLYRHAGCGPAFVALPSSSSSLSTTEVILIAAGGSVALMLVAAVAAFVLYVCCIKEKGRDNARAPKDPKKPFAMVFTDIQSSTKLWAQAPDVMGEALDAHNSIMHKAIRLHKGYEVKTIGDSFMVAFETVSDALGFSLTVQMMLYDYDFETPAFDDVYRETTREPLEAAGGEAAAAAHASYEDYTALWNGLRVRVGLHFGTGDIKFDANTNGYDYYGTVVNTAARVEGVGHGGQLLVTEAAMARLGEERGVKRRRLSQSHGGAAASAGPGPKSPASLKYASADFTATAQNESSMSLPGGIDAAFEELSLPEGVPASSRCLGPQPLRGLPAPVVLYEVLPEEFAQRRFPGLRLDVENEVQQAEDDATIKSGGEGTQRASIGSQSSMSSMMVDTSVDALAMELARKLRVRNPAMSTRVMLALHSAVVSMLAAVKPKEKQRLVETIVQSWRVEALRGTARMRRFEKALGKDSVSLLLSSSKVVQSLEMTAAPAFGSDSEQASARTTARAPGMLSPRNFHGNNPNAAQLSPGVPALQLSPGVPALQPSGGAAGTSSVFPGQEASSLVLDRAGGGSADFSAAGTSPPKSGAAGNNASFSVRHRSGPPQVQNGLSRLAQLLGASGKTGSSSNLMASGNMGRSGASGGAQSVHMANGASGSGSLGPTGSVGLQSVSIPDNGGPSFRPPVVPHPISANTSTTDHEHASRAGASATVPPGALPAPGLDSSIAESKASTSAPHDEGGRPLFGEGAVRQGAAAKADQARLRARRQTREDESCVFSSPEELVAAAASVDDIDVNP